MKKLIFLSLFLLTSAISNAQKFYGFDDVNDYDISYLKKYTHRVIKKLNIQVRDSISKDGELVPIVNRNWQHAMDASFSVREGDGVGDQFSPSRYYIHSYMQLSKVLYRVLTKKSDTTLLIQLKANSIVVHEITHYFQSTNEKNYIDANADFYGHLKQPSEFEAYSVESYYFFENYNKKVLRRIMHLKFPLRRRCELLINEYWKIMYSGTTVYPVE